jgi:hypothetical protein
MTDSNDELTIKSLFTELEGMIGGDEESINAGKYGNSTERIRDDFRAELRAKLQDLKKKYGVE